MDYIAILDSNFEIALQNDDVSFFKNYKSAMHDWELVNATAYCARFRKIKCLKYFLKNKYEMHFNICENAIIGNTLHFFIGKKIVKHCGFSFDYMTIWGNDVGLAIRLHRNKYLPFLIRHSSQSHFNDWWFVDAVKSNNFKAITILCTFFKINNRCVEYCTDASMLLHLLQHGLKFRKRHVVLNPKFFSIMFPKYSLERITIDDVNIFESWQYRTSSVTRHYLYMKLLDYFSSLLLKMEKVFSFPFPIRQIIVKHLLSFPIENNIVQEAQKNVLSFYNSGYICGYISGQ